MNVETENTPIKTEVATENAGAPVALHRYLCLLCGLIYDEAQGWPAEGIAAGTRWDDIPPNWHCPDCGATKDDFEMIQIA